MFLVPDPLAVCLRPPGVVGPLPHNAPPSGPFLTIQPDRVKRSGSTVPCHFSSTIFLVALQASTERRQKYMPEATGLPSSSRPFQWTA